MWIWTKPARDVEVCHFSVSLMFQNTGSGSHHGENDAARELIISRVNFKHSICAATIRFSTCKYNPYNTFPICTGHLLTTLLRRGSTLFQIYHSHLFFEKLVESRLGESEGL